MIRFTAAVALMFCACSDVWAATTPTDALRQVFVQADRILTDRDTHDRPLERLLAIRKLVNKAFDFRSAAELASGDHWLARTAAEQEEFTWLLADLLERAFVSHIASTAALRGGTRIRYLAESIDGATARVETAMARRDGGELFLDYRLIERDESWKIRDVAVDGVSVMANYRAQLDRVLGSASFPELLTQMRAKVGAVDLAARTAASPPPETTPVVEVSLPDTPELPAEVSGPVPMVSAVDARSQAATAPMDAISLPGRTASPVAAPAPEPRVAAVEPIRLAPPAGPPQIRAAPEVKSTPPAVTRRPRTLTTRAYWLRISTVESAEEAGRLVSRLRAGNLSVALERTSVTGKPMIQISVGPFRDAAEAVFKLLDLQAKGHDPFLVAERE